MKTRKYNYFLVIQQNFGFGWEDVSQYEATSTGTCLERTEKEYTKKDGTTGKKSVSLCLLDANEYRLMGYSTRIIFRKEKAQAVNF